MGRPMAHVVQHRSVPLFWLAAALVIVGGLIAIFLPRASSVNSRPAVPPDAEAMATSLTYTFAISPTGYAGTAWSPDGQSIVVAGEGRGTTYRTGFATLWDATTGQKRWTVQTGVPIGAMYLPPLSWSPDGRYVAGSTYTNTIYLLDPTTGRVQHMLRVPVPSSLPAVSEHGNPFVSFYFRVALVGWVPGSDTLVTFATISAYDGTSADHRGEAYVEYATLQDWDAATGQLACYVTLPSDAAYDVGAGLSRDGRYFVLTASHKDVVDWEIWSQAELKPVEKLPFDSTDSARSSYSHRAWSPDGTLFAYEDGWQVKLFNVNTHRVEHLLPQVVPPTYTATPTVYEPPRPLPTELGTVAPGTPARLGPPVPSVAPPPPRPVPSVPPPGYVAPPTVTPTPTPTPDPNSYGPVLDLAWSPDSKAIAAYYQDALRVWSATTGDVLSIQRHPYLERAWNGSADLAPSVSFAWSPNGKLLATAAGGVQLYDPGTLTLLRAISGVSDGVRWEPYFIWSPTSNALLVLRSDRPQAEVWTVQSSPRK